MRLRIVTVATLLVCVLANASWAVVVVCGDADISGAITALDALRALQAAVGATSCDECLCDTNGDHSITAGDALCILRISVGSACTRSCPGCGASVCGDGIVPPFVGESLGTHVHVDDCLLLDAESPGFSRDIEVKLVEALGTDLAAVEDAHASVDSLGCDCGFLVARQPRGNGSARHGDARVGKGNATATASSSTTSSTFLGACNCYVRVSVDASRPLAVVEAYINVRDGECDGAGFYFPTVARIDAGVEEECDDGNTVSGDGCSNVCRVEPAALCAADRDCPAGNYCSVVRAVGLCRPGCRSDADCPQGQVCLTGAHVCFTPTK